nr:myb domain protein 62 [Tanacetum cinerariifolium]
MNLRFCIGDETSIGTQLVSQHRSRKCRLHKHYQKYPTKEEATTHPPDGIMVADWVVLYEKKIRTTNKHNRSFSEVPPTIGMQSVARVIHMRWKQGEVLACSR